MEISLVLPNGGGRDGPGLRGWQMQTVTFRMGKQGSPVVSSDKS